MITFWDKLFQFSSQCYLFLLFGRLAPGAQVQKLLLSESYLLSVAIWNIWLPSVAGEFYAIFIIIGKLHSSIFVSLKPLWIEAYNSIKFMFCHPVWLVKLCYWEGFQDHISQKRVMCYTHWKNNTCSYLHRQAINFVVHTSIDVGGLLLADQVDEVLILPLLAVITKAEFIEGRNKMN